MPNTDKPNYRVRRAAHIKRTAEQRARKQIRGVRAEIHEAMLVAAAMARSKKKGTSKIEGNMETLGDNGRGLPVEQKYARR
jgi:hypothetical protein